MRMLFAALLALLAVPAVVFPATILVYVEETGDEGLTPEPHTVRGGVLDGLFEKGHIVFDTGETRVGDVSWAAGRSEELVGIATQGGASLVVLARSEMRSEPREGGKPSIEISLTYTLLDVTGPTPTSIATATLSANNRGKEEDLPAETVAHEIGARCAAAIHTAIGGARRFR